MGLRIEIGIGIGVFEVCLMFPTKKEKKDEIGLWFVHLRNEIMGLSF